MNPAVLSGQTSFFATFMASFLIWLLFATLLVLWLIDGRVKKEQVLHALFATVIAWVFVEMLKSLFPEARPFQTNGLVPMTLTIPRDGSFPSIHSAVAFALAATIWLHDKKTGILFMFGATLVAWGRVASNVHFFGDVFVGALVGILSAYLVERMHLTKFVR